MCAELMNRKAKECTSVVEINNTENEKDSSAIKSLSWV